VKTIARFVRRVVKLVVGVIVLFLVYLLVVGVVPGITAPEQPLEHFAPAVGQASGDAGRVRTAVTFDVDGSAVSAWLYLPDDLTGPAPAVVMANGAVGTKDIVVPEFAARFRDAGYAVLAFDYRYWGESEGEPRQLIWIPDQLADLAAAVEFARGRAEIDPSRIVLWGTSFGGGHVLATAAADHDIAAVIAQVPFLDGMAAMEIEHEGDSVSLWLQPIMHGQRDIVRSWLGLSAHTIPLVGKPGTIAVMPGQEAWDFFSAHAPEDYVNEGPARILIRADKYRPIKQVGTIECPVLLLMAENDHYESTGAIEEAATLLGGRATLIRYPIGHFEIYTGAAFEQAVTDQIAFLRQNVR
jgi:uncharacterized protein